MRFTVAKIEFIMKMLNVYSMLALVRPEDRKEAKMLYEEFQMAVDANGGFDELKKRIG